MSSNRFRALAQLALDLGVRVRSRGPKGIGPGFAADRLRRALIGAADPLVRYELAGFELEMPLSHELPYYRLVYPDYGANVARLSRVVSQKYPGAAIVDVGANVGDTAALVRSACESPLLCIEGDAAFFEILQRNVTRIPGVRVEKALVGPRAGTFRGEVQVEKGTARVVAGGAGALDLEPLEAILARHPDLPRVRLVKIDTDGFDCPIVESSMALWNRLRPVVFFEYDPAFYRGWDPLPMWEALAGIGYDALLAYENNGEYMVSLAVADRRALEDLHGFYSGRKSERYVDLAVFHADDADLAESFRRSELHHFREVREGGGATPAR